MPVANIVFLCAVVGAFCLFGSVLAWASWDETRRARRARE